MKLIEHKEYINKYGDDIPAIAGWRWGQAEGSSKSMKRDTAADNV